MFRSSQLSAILLLALGCGPKPYAPVAVAPGAKPTPARTPAPAGPATKMTAAEFAAAASADPEATLAKYGTVEIEGTVASVEGEGDYAGRAIPVRGDTGPPVMCVLAGPAVTGELGRGQSVTVRGRVGKTYKGCELIDCEVVGKGPPTVIRGSAAEIMAKFLAPGGAEAFAGKSVAVTGKVAGFGTPAMGNHQAVEFEVPAGTLVGLVDAGRPLVFSALKPGDELALAGDVVEADAKAKKLKFARGLPPPK